MLQETVAFTLRLDGHYSPALGERIPYNGIVTNVGSGYVTQRQEFVCPLAGVYAFHATVHAFASTRCRLYLYKNEESIACMWSDSTGAATGQGANMVALELHEADTVSVRSDYPDACSLFGDEMYNTFTGFKIE